MQVTLETKLLVELSKEICYLISYVY